MMRMKDSDDYITARAANPRTGLISPSVGTRTPCTPDSPGEALKRFSVESPTPAPRERSSLCRANEGRKISAGSARSQATVEIVRVPGAFPENHVRGVATVKNDLDGTHALNDDQFVVHMPSAREPQPFAYPGYTAEQIDALEHYRRKARRVSRDGYDRRLLYPQTSCNAYTDTRDCNCGDQHPTFPTPPYDRWYTPFYYDDLYSDRAHEDSAAVEPPRIMVRKRANARIARITHHSADLATRSRLPAIDPNFHAAIKENNETPETPPRTTKPTRIGDEHDQYASTLKRVPDPGFEVRRTKHAENNSATVLDEREMSQNLKLATDLAPRRSNTVANGDQYYLDDNEALPMLLPSRQPPESLEDSAHPKVCTQMPTQTILSKLLPRVSLVRPEHAAVPKKQRRTPPGENRDVQRQCSFGCRREGRNDECVERRQVSDATVVRRSSVLFRGQEDSTHGLVTREDVDKGEMLLEFATSALRYLGSLQVPRIDTLEVLKDPNVSAKEKVDALRTALSLAGHALAVCTILAMLWKLGAALMHLLEVISWPLAVPLRMLRWIVGAG